MHRHADPVDEPPSRSRVCTATNWGRRSLGGSETAHLSAAGVDHLSQSRRYDVCASRTMRALQAFDLATPREAGVAHGSLALKTEQALAPGASPEMNVPGEPRTEREWIFSAWTCCCLP
jgi:hypothetical protein